MSLVHKPENFTKERKQISVPYSFSFYSMKDLSCHESDNTYDSLVHALCFAKSIFPDEYVVICMANNQVFGMATSKVSALQAAYQAMTCDPMVHNVRVGILYTKHVGVETGDYLFELNVSEIVTESNEADECDESSKLSRTAQRINRYHYIGTKKVNIHEEIQYKVTYDETCMPNVLYDGNIGEKAMLNKVLHSYAYVNVCLYPEYVRKPTKVMYNFTCVVSGDILVSFCPSLSNIEDSFRYVLGKSTDWVVAKSKDPCFDPTFSCATEKARLVERARMIRETTPKTKQSIQKKSNTAHLCCLRIVISLRTSAFASPTRIEFL